MSFGPTKRDVKAILRYARMEHRRFCHDEPPYDEISVQHRWGHEANGQRALNRRLLAATPAEPVDGSK